MQQFPVFFFHHQSPFSTFRFFDIGKGKQYENAEKKRSSFNLQYDHHYQLLLKQIINAAEKDGLKCGVSFSGIFLELWKEKDPKMVGSFAKLIKSGSLSLISCGYHASISSLLPEAVRALELNQAHKQIQDCFGVQTNCFANPYLVYNNQVAAQLASAGYEACLTVAMPWHLNGRSSRQVFYCANKELRLVLHKMAGPDMSKENLIMPYYSMNGQAGEAWEYLKQVGNRKSTTLSLRELLLTNTARESYQVPRAISNKINGLDLGILSENPLQRAYLQRLSGICETALNYGQDHYLWVISPFYAIEHLELLNTASSSPTDDPYFYYLNLGNILTDLEVKMRSAGMV